MTDHAHDFDFLIGKWRVHHSRLKDRLADNHDWVEFEGTCEMRTTMGGAAIWTTIISACLAIPIAPWPSAPTIRNRRPGRSGGSCTHCLPHAIDPPVLGNFKDGVGIFEDDDAFNGKPINVRFTWSRITRQFRALGAGVFARWRQDLGDQLAYGFHEGRMSNVVELRQYTLKPGPRDTLIALFDREFVESQEACGMDLIGMFRDATNPTVSCGCAGFPTWSAAHDRWPAFYGGPVWKANRDAAIATMIDSDNVLLLRPAWDVSGFTGGGVRAPRGAVELPDDCVVAANRLFRCAGSGRFRGDFSQRHAAALCQMRALCSSLR